MLSQTKPLAKMVILFGLFSYSWQAVLIEMTTCQVPDNSLEWNPNPEQIGFDVHWRYDDGVTCNSKQTCNLTEVDDNSTDVNAAINTEREDRMSIQLRPVEFQPGNKLRFHLEPMGDAPIPKIYKVDEDAFLNCNVIGWLPITNGDEAELSIDVSYQLLRSGNNYFIAENEGTVRCDMGLRLNVTVKTDLCQHDLAVPVCNSDRGRGRCVTRKGQAAYSCHCCGNYKGEACNMYDACLSNPCYNGGECLGLTNGTVNNSIGDIIDYRCKCPLGYYGEQCETKVENLCNAIECKNNATCTGNATGFYCDCPPGFTGNHCEVDTDDCWDSPCRHGNCVDRLNGFDCECYPGYHGPRCEEKHERCMPNPCRHEGMGVNLTVSGTFQWQCHCRTMWQGKTCNERAHPCEANPCSPNGICVEGELDFYCRCEPGFTGRYCEVNINECDPNPCHHQGVCHDLANDYSCLCLNAHAGRNCQYTINIFNPVLDDEGAGDRATRLSEENRNLYIMAGALTMALIVVVTVLLICYCRRHDDVREICGIHVPTFKRKRSTSDDLRVNVDANNSLDCPLTSDSFFKNEPGCGPVSNPAFDSQVV